MNSSPKDTLGNDISLPLENIYFPAKCEIGAKLSVTNKFPRRNIMIYQQYSRRLKLKRSLLMNASLKDAFSAEILFVAKKNSR